ncbi:MAG: hypothetical protein SPH34_02460 [Lachnospiraceae bacterium]|nr:hypothetical protein [Lachnospiraceae bacterium]
MADQKNSEAYEFIEEISEKGLDLSYQIYMDEAKKQLRFDARKQRTFGETSTELSGTTPAGNWYRSDGGLEPEEKNKLINFIALVAHAI